MADYPDQILCCLWSAEKLKIWRRSVWEDVKKIQWLGIPYLVYILLSQAKKVRFYLSKKWHIRSSNMFLLFDKLFTVLFLICDLRKMKTPLNKRRAFNRENWVYESFKVNFCYKYLPHISLHSQRVGHHVLSGGHQVLYKSGWVFLFFPENRR